MKSWQLLAVASVVLGAVGLGLMIQYPAWPAGICFGAAGFAVLIAAKFVEMHTTGTKP